METVFVFSIINMAPPRVFVIEVRNGNKAFSQLTRESLSTVRRRQTLWHLYLTLVGRGFIGLKIWEKVSQCPPIEVLIVQRSSMAGE